MIGFWIVLILLAGAFAFVRLAPSDPERWHVVPRIQADRDMTGGVQRRIATGPDGLARFHAVALGAPRTVLLAGGPAEGHATYVARTKWGGFPDYVTAYQDGIVGTLPHRGRVPKARTR